MYTLAEWYFMKVQKFYKFISILSGNNWDISHLTCLKAALKLRKKLEPGIKIIMNVDVCQSCTIAVFQGCVGVDRQACIFVN